MCIYRICTAKLFGLLRGCSVSYGVTAPGLARRHAITGAVILGYKAAIRVWWKLWTIGIESQLPIGIKSGMTLRHKSVSREKLGGERCSVIMRIGVIYMVVVMMVLLSLA